MSYQEGSLGVFGALDAQRVELPLLQAALHQADGRAHAALDVLKGRSREALAQLVKQHLPGRGRDTQCAHSHESRKGMYC